MHHTLLPSIFLSILLVLSSCSTDSKERIIVKKDDRIVLIGNNLYSRMTNYGNFETEMHMQFPDKQLVIRNICDGGNTPGFRPHSGRNHPWAFPGAEKFQTKLSRPSGSEGHLDTEDQWLSRLEADIIIAFFGYNESFRGLEGLGMFKDELTAFIEHTNNQSYNGDSASQLILVSPIAFQNLSKAMDLPNGEKENKNLQLYAQAMRDMALKHDVFFVDAFHKSLEWFQDGRAYTLDGFQLNDSGYQAFSEWLVFEIFSSKKTFAPDKKELVNKAVKDKNWFWLNDFKIPNGVHVFGRRYDPFGPDNYPYEIQKIREMTTNRDSAIWALCQNKQYDLNQADANTSTLPPVESNFKIGKYGTGEPRYLYGEESINSISVAPGFKVDLFASEHEFPDLANPVQMSFDNKGRLWLAVIPSYPHYKPGDRQPNDKLIILEDTDQDGKADRQITWADGLHLPVGFEFAPEGVYVSQGTNLVLLTDTDDDDRADKKEIILSGFDDHDTHHVISAFCADPSGAIYMAEGVFLHSNIETAYGPVRATNGGFFRYAPQNKYLERTAQVSIPNPWGIAFDEWGQHFFAETSGPKVRWMMPSTLLPVYGKAHPMTKNLIEEDHMVRPTSGLEFVSSRHFPDDMQGDLLINNTIGFLGMKQHQVFHDGTGYRTKHRQDLIKSNDTNFRPVDMEFAPDGSLYFIDWHNVLIGHMQHNARDPLRDHVHGRVYRITYPDRPLVKPVQIDQASIPALLELLKLPEYRTRYRTRRELRARDESAVMTALSTWIENLEVDHPKYEQLLMEAMWVQWGVNRLQMSLLKKILDAKDYRVRAAGVRALRFNIRKIDKYSDLLKRAAQDAHGQVRLEAITAATWLPGDEGLEILEIASQQASDEWIEEILVAALSLYQEETDSISEAKSVENMTPMERGQEIYRREGFCGTCHQENGRGLKASGYPPLANSRWVLENQDRLIKLTLKGLFGPMEVLGHHYEGNVPMTPYEGLLNDGEIADVLNYIRNSFGNKAEHIDSVQVARVRQEVASKKGFYSPDELLSEHPFD